MRAIAIIPARMNSKRFPGKNARILGNKPLLKWTIDAANYSGVFDRIVVDCYDDEIMEIAGEYTKLRAYHLANDYYTSTDDIIQWYMDNHDYDCYCLLQPTTPFRSAMHIREAFALYEKFSVYNVISVNNLTFQPNGGIYLCQPNTLPYKGKIKPYFMDPIYSIDIDYEYQFRIAEGLLLLDVNRVLDAPFIEIKEK